MPHNPAHDHRRESAARRAEMRPLLTRDPLPPNREKKTPAQPSKKRKRITPTTPALSFHPRNNQIPCGRQYPPVSPNTLPEPVVPEPTPGLHGEQAVPPADRDVCNPLHGQYDQYDQYWSLSPIEHPIPSTNTSYMDMNDMNPGPLDPYDSPASHTSSSSPAPSDQFPEFTTQGADYDPRAQHMAFCTYDSEVYPPAHQDSYGFPMEHCPDHHEVCPVEYADRPGLHGSPVYPVDNGYPRPTVCRR